MLADGSTLHRRIVGRAIDAAGLSDDARAEALHSGEFRSKQRLGWAINNLNKAGIIERPSRANYRITETGRAWFADNPEGIRSCSEANRVFAPYWFDAEKTRPGVVTEETKAMAEDPIE
ncbi:winged helix-turn-helix domain-containing protein [Kocuria sabuli]|uniref:winged helix-turn-helix domain-containing protein n=1 Tax=Kocuria sabuli TaxID=3071448 RepID=UPI0034D4A387